MPIGSNRNQNGYHSSTASISSDRLSQYSQPLGSYNGQVTPSVVMVGDASATTTDAEPFQPMRSQMAGYSAPHQLTPIVEEQAQPVVYMQIDGVGPYVPVGPTPEVIANIYLPVGENGELVPVGATNHLRPLDSTERVLEQAPLFDYVLVGYGAMLAIGLAACALSISGSYQPLSLDTIPGKLLLGLGVTGMVVGGWKIQALYEIEDGAIYSYTYHNESSTVPMM